MARTKKSFERFTKLPDQIRAAHLDQRTIFMVGDVDDAWASTVLSDLHYLLAKGKGPIRIILSSSGGDVFSGFVIYNAIRDLIKHGILVNIEVFGLCASMASIILQAASKRIAHRATRFMIHEVTSLKLFSEETASEAKEHADELQKVNVSLIELLAERSNKSKEEIARVTKKQEYWMSAPEAKEFGLIDTVIN